MTFIMKKTYFPLSYMDPVYCKENGVILWDINYTCLIILLNHFVNIHNLGHI